MSLTDSNKKKNYSNKTDNNTKVAKINKKSTVAEHFGKGGVLYKGKSSKYPGISNIIKKNKLKVIPINIGLKKNK